MEVANTSETSVNFYQTTQRNIPEDSRLQITKYLVKEPEGRALLRLGTTDSIPR
jgi:hypothetical protein